MDGMNNSKSQVDPAVVNAARELELAMPPVFTNVKTTLSVDIPKI